MRATIRNAIRVAEGVGDVNIWAQNLSQIFDGGNCCLWKGPGVPNKGTVHGDLAANAPEYTTYAAQPVTVNNSIITRADGSKVIQSDPAEFDVTTPHDPPDLVTAVIWQADAESSLVLIFLLPQPIRVRLAGQSIFATLVINLTTGLPECVMEW